jgi:2-succinyl-5-enolpyruvyl-6-hydroxy-3-cyclohexene-1-carboxylate synthase
VARRLDAPLLADPLSPLRFGADPATLVVDGYDAFLRASLSGEAAGALAPDLVLRVGALPTSKALQLWLREHAGVRQILLGNGGWADPAQDAAWAVRADVASTCIELGVVLAEMLGDTPTADADWAARWRRVNAHTRDILAAELESDDDMSEPRLFAELAAALPAGATLWVSSSMPVRDLDSFGARRDEQIRVLANRGGNGIDGVVSSALGAAAASDGPMVLAIGDLAFYHDMNGLLAAKLHDLDATVVLVNNDGGGIFSFLPQGSPELVAARDFEALFGTPHGLDFSHAGALYGARFVRPESWPEFHAALAAAIETPGMNNIELHTDRAANVERHRELWAAVSAGVAELLRASRRSHRGMSCCTMECGSRSWRAHAMHCTVTWIPACAGVTGESAGVTGESWGMTGETSGMTSWRFRHSREGGNPFHSSSCTASPAPHPPGASCSRNSGRGVE